MGGWIKISKDIAGHWLWEDAERLKWWLDLLFMAAWEDRKQLHDSHLVNIGRGQMIASLSFLSKRWKRSKPTVIDFLKLLEDEKMIERKVVYRQTPILTICNYDRYQQQEDTSLYPQNSKTFTGKNGGEVYPQKTGANNCESKQLACKKENEFDTMVDAIVDTMVYPNKEIKEYNNIISSSSSSARARVSEDEEIMMEGIKDDSGWCGAVARLYGLGAEEVSGWIDGFALVMRCRGETHKDLPDAKRHFNDWLRLQLKEKRKEKEKSEKENERRKKGEFERQKYAAKRGNLKVTAKSGDDYKTTF